MKKSSLGRRSSTTQPLRLTYSDFESTRREKFSGIPVRTRVSSADRNSSSSASTLVRTKSLKEIPSSSAYDWRGGVERPSRGTTVSSSSLRTSSYGGTKSKTDNRPLQDREWQTLALRKIEEVVKEIPEGSGLFKTSIKPLTIKLFVEITDLLFSKLDPSISITIANYISEIPYLTKLMLYRGKVDKSWLISVNTQHAYKHVLGFLHFLASCYCCQIYVDPTALMYPATFMGSNQDSWNFKLMIPYFQESYYVYCSNHPDYPQKQLELDKQLLLLHFEDKNYLSNELSNLHSEKSNLEEVLAKKKRGNQLQNTEIQELKDAYDNLISDYKTKMEQLSLLKNDFKKIESEIANIDNNQDKTYFSLEEKKNVLIKLQNAIKNQDISQVGLIQIKEKCVSLQSDIESERKYIEEYENQIFQEDLIVVKLQKELNASIRNFVLMLEDVFDESTLESANIPKNVHDFNEENINNSCLYLENFKSKFIMEKKNVLIQDNQNKIDKLNEENANIESFCDNLEEKFNVIQEEINEKLLEHKKKMLQLNNDLAAIEEKTLQLSKNMPENCEDLSRRQTVIADEMEAELKEFKRRAKWMISERKRLRVEYNKDICEMIKRNSLYC